MFLIARETLPICFLRLSLLSEGATSPSSLSSLYCEIASEIHLHAVLAFPRWSLNLFLVAISKRLARADKTFFHLTRCLRKSLSSSSSSPSLLSWSTDAVSSSTSCSSSSSSSSSSASSSTTMLLSESSSSSTASPFLLCDPWPELLTAFVPLGGRPRWRLGGGPFAPGTRACALRFLDRMSFEG